MQFTSRSVQTFRAAARIFVAVWLCVFIGWISGCASQSPPRPVSDDEQIRRDHAVGLTLAEWLAPNFKYKNNTDVSVYLQRLAQALSDATPEFRKENVGVYLIQDRGSEWINYGLPGNRIYLSVSLLRTFHFENELAAAIAVELGHILKRHVVNKLQKIAPEPGAGPNYDSLLSSTPKKPPEIDYFGPAGLFAYSESEQIDAAEAAVDILYNAGYDSRGLMSLWKFYKENPKRAPCDSTTLDKLLDKTHAAIAQHAPLRNPIVRSESFLEIQKRIRRL